MHLPKKAMTIPSRALFLMNLTNILTLRVRHNYAYQLADIELVSPISQYSPVRCHAFLVLEPHLYALLFPSNAAFAKNN
jgi:hypothetical protein